MISAVPLEVNPVGGWPKKIAILKGGTLQKIGIPGEGVVKKV